MPRLVHRPPKYYKHGASGQAVVKIDGRMIYLGPHGTKASHVEYDRVIGEWMANGRRAPQDNNGITIAELIAAFWEHGAQHYNPGIYPQGKRPPGELGNYWDVLKPLKRLYAEKPVSDFGPLALKSIRGEMIKMGWCRNVINRQVARLKHVFKWGVSEELIPASVYEGIRTVAGLQRGRVKVAETEPVKPVPDEMIDQVLPHVSRQVAAIIKLQRITGARPDEICSMTTGAIDRTKPLWVYTPATHKTAHHGHVRTIFLGKRCQEILTPFLKLIPDAYIFSAAEAEAERLAARHAARKTPLNQGNKPGSNQKRRARRSKGDCYTVNSYRRAIARACENALPPPEPLAKRDDETAEQWKSRLTPEQREELATWRREHSWHPHQLRHNAATEWRQRYGAETTLVLLGDRTTRMVDIYAEKNLAAAQKIMAEVG